MGFLDYLDKHPTWALLYLIVLVVFVSVCVQIVSNAIVLKAQSKKANEFFDYMSEACKDKKNECTCSKGQDIT